jgi:hypothetical protein
VGNGNVSERLQRLSAELRQLSQEIKSGDVDPIVLRDFREAVDNARQTAWVVQSWLEKEGKRADPYALLPLLTAERIRRATQLSRNLAGDLAAAEVTVEGGGLRELFVAVESLYNPLANLFKK